MGSPSEAEPELELNKALEELDLSISASSIALDSKRASMACAKAMLSMSSSRSDVCGMGGGRIQG